LALLVRLFRALSNWLCSFKNYMATPRQIDANRRNARKSTGPKSQAGKAAVSMNSLRHGLRARSVVLPGENHEEFQQLCDNLEAEWHPRTSSERFYVEQMAVSHWKLGRTEVGESHVFQEVTDAKSQIPLLDRLWQAQCRMERSYARAQRELERLQGNYYSVRSTSTPQSEEEPVEEPVEEEDVPCEESPADPQPEPDPEQAPKPKPTRILPFIPTPASAAAPASPLELATLEPKGRKPS
jgi:hypothetical protein